MCKAIQDIRLEGYEQGIEQGVRRTVLMMSNILRSVGISDEDIIARIVENSNITREDAERYVKGK